MSDANRLPPALPAQRRTLNARAGPLSYYVAGDGPPLLLVHSINAAASAYEVRPVFERMTADRRVFAPDLPGFGFSDRSRRDYSARLYTDAILDMLDEIDAQAGGGAAIDALAVSLSSEFLARAALERPGRFRTLALVTPTGFNARSAARRGAPGSTREVPGLYAFFTFPLWSAAIFTLLVSRRSMRFFLEKTFGSTNVDRGLLDYAYRSAHQPGARNAPYAFVSGRLFSADIGDLYRRLTMPIWMPHATRGDFRDFSGADWARASAHWRVQPYDSGALPYFEQPGRFVADYRRFLDGS